MSMKIRVKIDQYLISEYPNTAGFIYFGVLRLRFGLDLDQFRTALILGITNNIRARSSRVVRQTHACYEVGICVLVCEIYQSRIRGVSSTLGPYKVEGI